MPMQSKATAAGVRTLSPYDRRGLQELYLGGLNSPHQASIADPWLALACPVLHTSVLHAQCSDPEALLNSYGRNKCACVTLSCRF